MTRVSPTTSEPSISLYSAPHTLTSGRQDRTKSACLICMCARSGGAVYALLRSIFANRYSFTGSRSGPSIAHYGRAPGQPAAEGFEQKQITALDPPISDSGVKCHRHGRARGVAVLVVGEHDALHGHLQPLRSGLDDAHLGVMRNEPVDLAFLEPVTLEHVE